MRIRSASLAAAAVLFVASAAHAGPVTLDFEGTGVAPAGVISPVPLPYVEDGFVLHNGPPAAESGIFGADTEGEENSGSDFFGWAFNGAIVLEQVGGGAFTFNSFDAGHIGAIGGVPAVLTLKVTGNLEGGGSVVANFDYTNPWQTFVLPDTFTGLSSVVFLSSMNGDAGIDNLTINATRVDEGDVLIPLALSAFLLVAWQGRRKRAPMVQVI